MSKTLLPWSLKGVSLEARSRAKMAAGAAGEPLGKWLSDTIRHVAETGAAKAPPAADSGAVAQPEGAETRIMVDPDTQTPEAPPIPVVPAAAPLTTASVGQTDDGRSAAAESDAPTPASAPAPPRLGGAPPTADWQSAFDDLSRRLDETDRRMAAAVERVLARLDDVDSRRRPRWRLPGLRLFRRDQ
jgi:hypothetical protein